MGDNFIEKKLINDIPLIKKYKILKKRKQIIYDPNYQICPYPDCESYSKKGNNKYVSCINNGHKFCLKCLKNWHGNEPCQIDHNESFEKWKNANEVKWCPKCKYFVEKNEGCNHITCSYCNYQWCWLCLNEYELNHSDENCPQNSDGCGIFLVITFYLFFCIIILTLFVFFSQSEKKSKKIIGYYPDGFIEILYALILILVFFYFLIPLISISTFISLIVSIIWPLQIKYIDYLKSIY